MTIAAAAVIEIVVPISAILLLKREREKHPNISHIIAEIYFQPAQRDKNEFCSECSNKRKDQIVCCSFGVLFHFILFYSIGSPQTASMAYIKFLHVIFCMCIHRNFEQLEVDRFTSLFVVVD